MEQHCKIKVKKKKVGEEIKYDIIMVGWDEEYMQK